MYELKPGNDLNHLGTRIWLDRYARRFKGIPEPGMVIVFSDGRTIGKIESVDPSQMTATAVVLKDYYIEDDSFVASPSEERRTVDVSWKDGTNRNLTESYEKVKVVDPDSLVPAGAIEKYLTPDYLKGKGFMKRWRFVPGGRILANFDVNKEKAETSLFNCYVVPSPTDSREGIIQTMMSMTEIMSRGGGVGFSLSSLRPKDAPVYKLDGRSSGSVSWGGMYSDLTGKITQGGTRRGALMLIQEVWHPDIEEFINAKRDRTFANNCNMSVMVSDSFISAVKEDRDWSLVFPDTSFERYDTEWDGILERWVEKGYPVKVHKTIPARELWNQIIESAWDSAEPGIIFRDTYNHYSNTLFLGDYIRATNPCLVGDTLLNNYGVPVPIEKGVGKEDDPDFSWYSWETGEKDTIRLITNYGHEIVLTPDHPVRLASGEFKPASSLIGQEIEWGLGDSKDFDPVPYYIAVGALFRYGYSTPSNKELRIEVEPYKKELISYLQDVGFSLKTRYDEGFQVFTMPFDDALYQFEHDLEVINPGVQFGKSIPSFVWDLPHDQLVSFLYGYLNAAFRLYDGKNLGILIGGEKDFLLDLQRLSALIGIRSSVRPSTTEARKSEYPYELHIPCVETARNDHLFKDLVPFIDHTRDLVPLIVDRIEEAGKRKVYDYRMKEGDPWNFANGFVCHNCGEQGLPDWGVCNLGSVNLAAHVKDGEMDWNLLEETVELGVRFLDEVIDHFSPIPHTEVIPEHQRRIGLGIMGLAEALAMMGIRYGTRESAQIVDQIMERILYSAYSTSIDLAEEKGMAPILKAHKNGIERLLKSRFIQEKIPKDLQKRIKSTGLRNMTLLSIAPTGTIGTMVNTSTGIEPYPFKEFRYSTGVGEVVVRPRPLEMGVKEEFVPTIDELSVEEHLIIQETMQRYVDSSISKTVNLPESATPEEVGKLYLEAHSRGLKGLTIYREGSRTGVPIERKEDPEEEQTEVPEKEEPSTLRDPLADIDLDDYVLSKEDALYISPNLSGDAVWREIEAPLGKIQLFVRVSPDDGLPYDIWVIGSKAGTDVHAYNEALGRLISTIIRMTSSVHPFTRMALIVDQLRGIGGTTQVFSPEGLLSSVPDAVAVALEKLMDEYWPGWRSVSEMIEGGDFEDLEEIEENSAPVEVRNSPSKASKSSKGSKPSSDLCPLCGAPMVHQDGCPVCSNPSCGYSKCG